MDLLRCRAGFPPWQTGFFPAGCLGSRLIEAIPLEVERCWAQIGLVDDIANRINAWEIGAQPLLSGILYDVDDRNSETVNDKRRTIAKSVADAIGMPDTFSLNDFRLVARQ